MFCAMGIRFIALDLDGTLLGEDGTVPVVNRRAVERAAASGVIVVLCSGRHHADVDCIARDLGMDMPAVSSNGALVLDSGGGRIRASYLPGDTVAPLERMIIGNDARGVFYTDEEVVIHPDCPVIDWYRRRDRELRGMLGLTETGDIAGYLERSGGRVLKAAGVSRDPEAIARLEEAAAVLGLGVTQSSVRNLEFMAAGTDKAAAMEAFLRTRGAGFPDLLAAGDGRNDIELVRSAGVGVAMGNAVETLKAAADFIVSPNTEGGVAEVIDLLLDGRLDIELLRA